MRIDRSNGAIFFSHQELLLDGIDHFCNGLNRSLMKEVINGLMDTAFNRVFNWDDCKIDLLILISLDDICDRPIGDAFRSWKTMSGHIMSKGSLGTKIAYKHRMISAISSGVLSSTSTIWVAISSYKGKRPSKIFLNSSLVLFKKRGRCMALSF